MSTTILVPLDQVRFSVENGFLSLSILYGAEDVASEILEKAENQPDLVESPVRFDVDRKRVYIGGKCVKLPFKQFQIVHFLWTHGPVQLEDFITKFWGDPATKPRTYYTMQERITKAFLEQDIACAMSFAKGNASIEFFAQ